MTFDSLPPPPRLSSRNSPNSGTRHRPQENVKPARKRKKWSLFQINIFLDQKSGMWMRNMQSKNLHQTWKKPRFSKDQRSIISGALKHYENQSRSVERLRSSSLHHYSVLQRMNTMTLQWIRPHSFLPLKKRAQYLSTIYPKIKDRGMVKENVPFKKT